MMRETWANKVRTGSGSDRVILSTHRRETVSSKTRSLPLPLLNSSTQVKEDLWRS